jgi:hypothetical protein
MHRAKTMRARVITVGSIRYCLGGGIPMRRRIQYRRMLPSTTAGSALPRLPSGSTVDEQARLQGTITKALEERDDAARQ